MYVVEVLKTGGPMLARLGRAIYWFCCLLAAVVVALGIAAWFDRFSAEPNGQVVMLFFAAAAASGAMQSMAARRRERIR